MGQSKYHSTVIQHIHRFGMERSNKYIVSRLGSKEPIHIIHPQAKRKHIDPIQYEPDVYFVKKGKGKIVFEVLDSQLKKVAETISDIIQCSLASDVSHLVFIGKFKSDDEDKIFDMYDVIKDTLVNLGVSKDWIPRLATYYITNEETRSYKKVANILTKLSRTDHW